MSGRACRSLCFTFGERSWPVDSQGGERRGVRPLRKSFRDRVVHWAASPSCRFVWQKGPWQPRACRYPQSIPQVETGQGDTVPVTPARIEVRLTNGVCIFVPYTKLVVLETSFCPADCPARHQCDGFWRGPACIADETVTTQASASVAVFTSPTSLAMPVLFQNPTPLESAPPRKAHMSPLQGDGFSSGPRC